MLIGADFVWEETSDKKCCSECHTKSRWMLVSRQCNKVKKRVCSDTCRQSFDDSYWQARADQREDRANKT